MNEQPLQPTSDRLGPSPDHRTDMELMAAYRDLQDRSALAELFRRHHLKLFRWLCCVTGDTNLAEDVAQETWHRVMNKRGTFNPVGERFLPWLFRIGYSQFVNSQRGQARSKAVPFEEYLDPEATDSLEALDAVIRNESVDRLREALCGLTPQDRSLISMHYFLPHSVDEIARVFAVTTTTVHTRLHRIRHRLAELLAALDRSPSLPLSR